MNINKQNILMITIVFGLIIIVVSLFISISNTSSLNQTSNGQQPLSDDSKNHHQGVAVNETVFNSLLNKKAPNFKLESFDGKIIELEKLKGKKVVLFFTEGLMCYPACWNQMAAFGEDSAFNNSDVVTLNIAVDNKNDWGQALEQMPQLKKAVVLFDSDRSVSAQYGALTLPSSMHKGQYPGHTYLIVDRDGIIRFTYDDPMMGVRNDELKKELEKIK